MYDFQSTGCTGIAMLIIKEALGEQLDHCRRRNSAECGEVDDDDDDGGV